MQPMLHFSEVYEKTRKTISKKRWHKTQANGREINWQHVLKTDCTMQLLLSAKKLDHAHEQALAKLRNKLNDEVIFSRINLGALIASVNDAAKARQRMPSPYAFNLSRAGALKMLYHLYFVRKRGAQGVWVYSPPVSNQSWVYAALKSDPTRMIDKLNQRDEYFTLEQRDIIGSASELAMQWCNNALATGGIYKDVTVANWFLGNDQRVKKAAKRNIMQKVNIGLQKMINLLNSNTLIFSYHPKFGNTTALPAGVAGFVYPYEKMDVLYIKNDFEAHDGKPAEWHCAKTIIHEVSHRVLKTKDHSYGWQGLKPSNTGISAKQAIDNADTWAYFVTDISFNLTDTQRARYLVPKHR
ncbi:M35 family metallo-endopeptidase [Ningiella sp. W23]|uniref:M35 family metallo-endopeptidase n=1 Tax=Ningiella sp. W23 TaxID=3023715 RepID=UPI00375835BE